MYELNSELIGHFPVEKENRKYLERKRFGTFLS